MKEYLFISETVFVGIAHDCFFALKSPNFLTNGVKVCTPPKDAPSLWLHVSRISSTAQLVDLLSKKDTPKGIEQTNADEPDSAFRPCLFAGIELATSSHGGYWGEIRMRNVCK